MTTVSISHEVKDPVKWSNAWKKGPNGRHELFAKYGMKTRTFKDPADPKMCGVVVEVPDMKKFDELMNSDLAKKSMEEDGLKPETVRILTEFEP